jgi:filamentous hemagglutinin
MDLDDEIAQSVLSKGMTGPNRRQVYAFHEGKLYEFQPDNVGGYHGYPIPGTEAPIQVLRHLLRNKIITKSQYKKLLKGK